MDKNVKELEHAAKEILKAENSPGHPANPNVDLLNLIADIIVEIIIRQTDEQRNRIHKKK